MSLKTNWSVSVAGVPMTSAMSDYLQSITVTDKAGASSDSCSLVFDDTGGQIRLPQPGAPVQVALQGVQVFSGFVEKPNSSGSRSSGRTLSVSCKGFDVKGKAKEPQRIFQDEGTVGAFLEKVAKKAGFNMKIDPALANIVRDYIAADSESLLHVGQKIARELGGTFKLRGNEAVLVKHGGDFGLPLIKGLFTGDASGNVISWSIEPLSTREVFSDIIVPFFDRAAGKVKDHKASSAEGGKRSEAVNVVRHVAHDENHAKDIAEGRKQQIEREGGSGSVKLDLTPEAQAEASFTLNGTRAGVDGTYRIDTVSHSASRSSGATTSLSLKQPQGSAGTDGR